MRHKRNFVLALLVLVAMPLLACDPNVVNAWGDLLASAQFIWDSIWTTPERAYEAIGILCTQSLLATYGEPPVTYVDAIAMTTQEIAAAWGVSVPYSTTFTLGTPDAPHAVILLPAVLSLVFAFLESRRLQDLELIRMRVRWLERCLP